MRPAGRHCAGRSSRRPARGDAFTELFNSTPSPRASGTLGTHPKGVARDRAVRAGARGLRGLGRPEQRRKDGVDRLPLKFAGGQRSLNTFAFISLPERRAAGGAALPRLGLGLRAVRGVRAEPGSQVVICCGDPRRGAAQEHEDSLHHHMHIYSLRIASGGKTRIVKCTLRLSLLHTQQSSWHTDA